MKIKRTACLLTVASLILTGCKISAPKEAKPEYKEAFQTMCEVLDGRYKTKIKVLDLEMTEEEYQAKKESARKKLPDVVTEGELYCVLQEFAAGFRDLHTVVRADYQQAPEEFYFLPYSFISFDGEYYVTQCPASEQNYLGWKLCGINGTSIKEIRKKMNGFLPKENEYSLNIDMETALSSVDVLCYLSIIEDRKGEVVLSLKNPETEVKQELMCKSTNYQQKEEIEYQTLLRDKNPQTAQEAIYRSFQIEEGAYFIQINQHTEDEDFSVNQFKEKILKDLETGKPEKIIMDLRYNSGGYSDLFRDLMEKLQKYYEKTGSKIYTLISNRTASAALMMAVEARTKLDSTLAGEPTSQRPNFNGHMANCKLGSTSLEFQYATLYIRTLAGGDDLLTLEPDILIPQTMEAWKNGEDTVVKTFLAVE